MAIGLGEIFGFEIKDNFKYPYISKSISEFWRRWHISLGSWFREYVYIPLGGNRGGVYRTLINLLVVFMLTGFWHGANWTFLIWGFYNGVFVVLERVGKERLNFKRCFLNIYTLLVINVGWVLFRADNVRVALQFVHRMINPVKYKFCGYYLWEFVDYRFWTIQFIAIMGAGVVQVIGNHTGIDKIWKCSWLENIFCVIILFLSIISMAGNTYNPFIYFRF